MTAAASVESTVEGVRRSTARAQDVQEVLQVAATAVRRAVPHAAAAWLATDPVTGLFSHGHIEAFGGDVCAPWFQNELSVEDVHKFRHLEPGRAAVGSTIEDRAGRSPRWSDLMRPAGYDDELRISCADGGDAWAAIELQREVGDREFGPDDVAMLEALAPVVAGSLRRVTVHRAAQQATATGPGIVQVHPDGTVTPITAAGELWLDRLPPPSGAHTHTALLGVAQLGAALADGSLHPAAARVRARTVDGGWLTLHAQPTLDGDGDVAVVLEPSHPAAIAEVMARAHGLTVREREVVLALSRGASTKEMAQELFLSRHTVRDHVKAAMRKVGVSSRGQLVAALFERHYAETFFEGVTHTA